LVDKLFVIFARENLRERDHLVKPGVDGWLILRRIFRKWDVEGMDWIKTGGGHLRMRK
jgi:hypothetical protein